MSDNEDCILNSDDKTSSSTNDSKPDSLRRSSRAIKRKKYDDEDTENGDEESDIEEVSMEDPLNSYHGKNKTIIVNDTKTLVEMAAKQMKANQGNNEKKEPTVVIIDTNSILSGKGTISQSKGSLSTINSTQSAQDLYQSIAARGTTVTPVSKNLTNATTQSSSQQLILPSLTDDMFVVEAPSFIVPYVYEKPSIKPFREFVDTLGKELEEKRAKEEQEKKDKGIKDPKDKEVQEKSDKEKEEELDEMEVDGEKETKTPTEEIEEAETPKKKKSKRGIVCK